MDDVTQLYVLVAALFLFAVVFVVLGCIDQRRIWRLRYGWQLRNARAAEPSDDALLVQRLRFILPGIALALIALWALGQRDEVASAGGDPGTGSSHDRSGAPAAARKPSL